VVIAFFFFRFGQSLQGGLLLQHFLLIVFIPCVKNLVFPESVVQGIVAGCSAAFCSARS